jgi:ABC-type lipoprotein export system ATPase subunit
MVKKNVLIETVNLTKIYNGDVMALAEVNLSVSEGEFLTVMGPSGSGKSTLLNLLGALDRPTSGEVVYAGERLSQVRDLDRFRARMVGFVFQMHNLLPTMTARENIEIPMRALSFSGRERRMWSETLLTWVDLADWAHHLPSQLSGGQRQRVAIARALANGPRLVLADEPTGNLDTASGREVMDVFRRLNKEQGTTIVVVTHDPVVARCTDRIVVLSDGKIDRDEPLVSPGIEELRQLRASELGQALMAGILPPDVKGIGLETLLPGFQKVLRNV